MTQQRREAVAGLALSAGRGVRQAAAALIHPYGYVWWATDQPPDDRAITALAATDISFGS